MADNEKVTNEEKLEELQKAISGKEENLTDEKKPGFWAFVWKWAKRLALPVGVILGYLLKSLMSGGDDDESETPETPAE